MYIDDTEYARLREVCSYLYMGDHDALSHLAKFVDGAGERTDLPELRRTVGLGSELLRRTLSPENIAHTHYCMGNAWSCIRAAEHTTGRSVWAWTQPEFEQELKHFRLAANSAGFRLVGGLRQVQILTNTGNLLSHVGRSLEAAGLFDGAERSFSEFGMAVGNGGIALCHIAQAHYDRGQSMVVLHQAHRKLVRAISQPEQLDIGALEGFVSWREWVESVLPTEFLSKPEPTKQFPLGASDNERAYRSWCLRHRLFLNPMNDAGQLTVAATDTVHMPNHVMPLGTGPGFFGMFNQIKQEFVAARMLLWEGLHAAAAHFADREVLLMNTLDYPAHCMAVEKQRIAFRLAYSLLDKVSFLLNKYLALGIKDNLVNLNRLWFKDGQPSKGLSVDLVGKENWPLRGLFWLARDLFDEGEFVDALDPDAQDLKNIRDHLEHKYLKVHDDLWAAPDVGPKGRLEDQFAYSVGRSEFGAKTLRLLSLTRCAIIYCALAIHCEERLRAEKRPSDAVVPPMTLPKIADESKR